MTPRRCLNCTRIIPNGTRCKACEQRRVARYDRNHRQARRINLARAGYQCEQCGATRNLQAHHVRKLRDGGVSTIDNYRILCPACHVKQDRGKAA